LVTETTKPDRPFPIAGMSEEFLGLLLPSSLGIVGTYISRDANESACNEEKGGNEEGEL